MEYSEYEMQKIRLATDAYRKTVGSPNRPLSWAKVLQAVAENTGFAVAERNRENYAEYLRRWRNSRKYQYKQDFETKQLIPPLVQLLQSFGYLAFTKTSGTIDISLAYNLRQQLVDASDFATLSARFSKYTQFAGVGYADDRLNQSAIFPESKNLRLEVKFPHCLSHAYLSLQDTEYDCIKIAEYTLTTSDIRLDDNENLGSEVSHSDTYNFNTIGLITENYAGYIVYISQHSFLFSCCNLNKGNHLIISGIFFRGADNNALVALSGTSAWYQPESWSSFDEIFDDCDMTSKEAFENHLQINPQISYSMLRAYYSHVVLSSQNLDYKKDKFKNDLQEIFDRNRSGDFIQVISTIKPQQEQQLMHQLSEKDDLELLGDIRNMKLSGLKEAVRSGIRVDVPDPKDGKTAIHVMALMGWRRGIRIISEPDLRTQWNYALRDHEGFLPSYYAFVYSDDRALARLLECYESIASQRMGGPKHPLSFIAPLEIRAPSL